MAMEPVFIEADTFWLSKPDSDTPATVGLTETFTILDAVSMDLRWGRARSTRNGSEPKIRKTPARPLGMGGNSAKLTDPLFVGRTGGNAPSRDGHLSFFRAARLTQGHLPRTFL